MSSVSFDNTYTGSSSGSSSGTQEGLGSHSGRVYRHQNKYYSLPAVLPDLLSNIMRGCTEDQIFELYSKRMRIGCVSFKVVDPETFEVQKSATGSLELSFMTPLFWRFVRIPNLKAAFDIKDERAIQCIQEIFESVLRGVKRGEVSIGSHAKVEFYCSAYQFRYGLKAEKASDCKETYEKITAFLKDFDGSAFLGQLK